MSILPSNVSEKIDENLTPQERVRALARRKARGVYELGQEFLESSLKTSQTDPSSRPKSLVAADTLVFLGDQVLEKPQDPLEAYRMLKSLSGAKHLVCTGVCVLDLITGQEWSDVESSWVYFRELSEEEIQTYIDSREPFDKAGAYGIQGPGSGFIQKLEGNKDNVMGLPVRLTEKLLIQCNYWRLQREIKDSAQSLGGVPAQVVAVSKLQPIWKIEHLYSLGQRLFAENYVQEALQKQEQLRHLPEIQWHLIGPIQSKKINQVLGRFNCLQSVDRWELLEKMELKLQTRSEDQTKSLETSSQAPVAPSQGTVAPTPQKFFLQLNLAGESTKSGFSATEILEKVDQIKSLKHLQCAGLMTLPPPGQGEKFFNDLRDLSHRLRQMGLESLTELSMGTSEDYPTALKCGSTQIRVGEALFGPRGPTLRAEQQEGAKQL